MFLPRLAKNKSFKVERKQKEFGMQFNFQMHFELFAHFTKQYSTKIKGKVPCVHTFQTFFHSFRSTTVTRSVCSDSAKEIVVLLC